MNTVNEHAEINPRSHSNDCKIYYDSLQTATAKKSTKQLRTIVKHPLTPTTMYDHCRIVQCEWYFA
jgi:hypothetical protein